MNNTYSRRSHFIGNNNNNYTYYEQPSQPKKHSLKLPSFLYFPITVMWMEIIIKLSSGFSIVDGLFFTSIFTISISCILTLLCTFFKSEKINRRIAIGVSTFLAIWYNAQLVYNNVFGTFFVISSITNGGTTQALNSIDMIMTAIGSRIIYILLNFLPLALCIIFGKKTLSFKKANFKLKGILLAVAIITQIAGAFVATSGQGNSNTKSNYNLYCGELQQNAACERFGLYTMQRLDISRMIFGYKSDIREVEETKPTSPATADTPEKKYEPQIIETNFKKLSENTNNEDLKSLYNYFSTATPSYTNEYTGIFEDYNIIFLTAESFSQYAIDKELTPTLYKLYNEGFQFDNYYSPAWGVSTTDGEYANLTGLIPKSGVWSFSRSAEQGVNFPFTLSEQSLRNGYDEVRAYHNHTYDYYDRDQYLTNIGYDYSAVGKGLDLGEDVWPNSDLKMVQQTVDDYINSDKFSVYYMTVSGHGGYSYNTISQRNAELVEHLEYSDEVKGYLAANIELDRAVEYLINRLEEIGKLNKTLFCITDDHYPYSLDEFNGLDELAGHQVDTTFERYKNAWLLWSASMDKPVKVETQCSSLDILPTMLNMLGFEYDSRTIIGTDVFGEKEPFVVFGDRSWISQNGKYNSNTGEYTPFENAKITDDIDLLNNKCTNMFTISRMILDTDVYSQMYNYEHIIGK